MIGFARSPGRRSMASARSLSQFQKAFSDEASCTAFMFKRRWPDGFVCPACGKRRVAALKSRPRLHECLDCGRQPLRSEEHTSELQSRQYLVCRLLLEKKKMYPGPPTYQVRGASCVLAYSSRT